MFKLDELLNELTRLEQQNAHLIAAAPVMLKGLRRAEQTVRNLASELEGDAKQIAENEAANLRDDIAKAEGDNNG